MSFGCFNLYVDLRKSMTASSGANPLYLSKSRTCWAFGKGVRTCSLSSSRGILFRTIGTEQTADIRFGALMYSRQLLQS